MKLAWCTDIHLNFLETAARLHFAYDIAKTKPDALLITGDIGESQNTIFFLQELEHQLKMPIYFVLGNHDFWHSSVKEVTKTMSDACFGTFLRYLPEQHCLLISSNTALIGVNGWADGRYGNYKDSYVQLVDSIYIAELAKGAGIAEMRISEQVRDKQGLVRVMRRLAKADAQLLKSHLESAMADGAERIKRIIVATHIPPFAEVSYYRGEMSDPAFLPFYSCKATGDVLLAFAKANPDIAIDVYCGHTHGAATYKPLPNLTVEAGAAEYRYPAVQKLIEI